MKRITKHIHIFFYISLLILNFAVFPNLGKAQFGPVNFLTENVYMGDFDVADFDNDGDLDVVMGSHSFFNDDANDRFLVWYENDDTTDELWIPHTFNTSHSAPGVSKVVAKDFDNDGWIDIIIYKGGIEPFSSYYYKNEGNPGNLIFTETPLAFTQAYKKMLAGDINGDGFQDLICASRVALTSVINQGSSAAFSDNLPIDEYDDNLTFEYIDFELADLDLDGDLDIVAAAQETDNTDYNRSLFWYENEDGLGNFSDRILIEYESSCQNEVGSLLCSSDIEIADFNSDGLPDIFYQRGGARIHFQEVNQSFSNPMILDPNLGLFTFSTIKAADMDQDGDMDIVRCGLSSGGLLMWARNIDGNGTFEQVLNWGYEIGLGATNGIVADIEGDGDLDVIFHNGDSGLHSSGVFAFQNEGTGDIFSDFIQISDNVNGDFQMFNTDMDEDGDEDLIYLAETEGDIYWQENLDANGNFSTPIPLFHDHNIRSFALGDLDGDGDLDITVSRLNNSIPELYFYEKLDNSPTFGPKTIVLSSGAYYENIQLADMDADGDLDMVYKDWFGYIITWLENQGGLNFANTHTLVEGELLGTANFDGDNFSDLYYIDDNDRHAVLIRESLNPGTTILLSDSTEFLSFEIADIDNDGDDELITQERVFSVNNKLFLYAYENGNLVQHFLAEGFILAVTDVLDLDSDGKKDIVYPSGWLRQQSSIFDYGHIEFGLEPLQGGKLIHMANLDGIGAEDFIFQSRGDGLTWRSNQLANGYLTEGKVFLDYDENCEFEATQDTTLYGWVVKFEKDDLTYFGSTSPFGNYSGYLPDSGDYLVNVLRPSAYWGTCVEDTTIMVLDTSAIYTVDFPITIEQECPLLGLDINSTFLRPCIPGKITYSYCNYGTVTAEDAQLEIQLDDWMLIDSTSIPWSSTTDSSYIFDLGDIESLDCQNIYIYVTPDCQESEVGDIACFEGYITPDEICLPLDSLWDGSTIEATAVCDNDSITFKLQNIGSGDMEIGQQFRIEYIVNDDIVMLFVVDTFQLEADEIKEIKIADDQDVFRIEADQHEAHPIVDIASTMISNCMDINSGNLLGLFNDFPNEDGNPFSETYCRTLTGSYDPNLKEAFPQGQYDAYIDNDWELEYNIHFQNTGNDTAFTVVIKDQISEHLDLSTLKIGAASHDFIWDINFDRTLSFSFENILLPDSSTNLLGSQGFVQFFIQPKPELDVLTNIDNHAAIFFDANDPILTDNVRRIIRKPITTESQVFQLCEGEYFNDIQISADTIIIDTIENNLTGCHLVFNNIISYQTLFFIDSLVNSGDIVNGQLITQDTVFITTGINDIGCETTTYLQVSLPTSIDQPGAFKPINIFPNPASDQIYIDWQDAIDNNALFEIRNTNGQLVKAGKLDNPIIRTKYLPVGLYILKVKSANQLGLAKLIIF